MNSSYRRSFLFSLILLIAAACGGPPNDNEGGGRRGSFGRGGPKVDKGTSVEATTVSRKSISRQINSYGTIQTRELVNITPQVSDRVTNVFVDIGDTVRQGDMMAQIYKKPFRDQVEQARATLRQNRSALERDSAQYARQQELYEKNLVSSTEFDQARASFQASKAQYESSRSNLEQSIENLKNTKVRSPVYGVVVSRSLSEGDVATTGQTIFEIANLTGFETRVFLPLEEWRMVQMGQPVNMRVSNQPNIAARGRVTRINPRLDPTTGLGEVVISLTNRGSSIYQGVLVESSINVETHESALVIPRSALIENVQTLIEPESNTIQLKKSYSVFVVKGDTLAEKRDLELGIEQGDRVEVLSGLNAGDQLIITGQAGLQDGAKVRVAGSNPYRQSTPKGIDTATDTTETGSTGNNSSNDGKAAKSSPNSSQRQP